MVIDNLSVVVVALVTKLAQWEVRLRSHILSRLSAMTVSCSSEPASFAILIGVGT